MADQVVRTVVTADDKASGVIKNISTSIDNVGGSAAKATSGFNNVGLAVTAVGAGITLFAKNAVEKTLTYASHVKALSMEIGDNWTQTSRLLAVSERLGVTQEAASVSFGILSRNIQNARENTNTATVQQEDYNNKIDLTNKKIADLTLQIRQHGDKTGDLRGQIGSLNIDLAKYKDSLDQLQTPFQKLGIATQNADGTNRSFDQILFSVADKFKSMPNGIEKTADAMKLFGRSGRDMLPLLNQGSSGIQDLEKQADKLGLTLTASNVVALQKFTRASKDAKDAQSALDIQVGLQTLPLLTKFKQAQSAILTTLLTSPIKDETAAFLAFGGPVLTAAGGLANFGSNAAQILEFLPMLPAATGAAAVSIGILGGAALAGAGILGITLISALKSANDHMNDNGKTTNILADATNDLNKKYADATRANDNLNQANAVSTQRQSALKSATQDVADAQTAANKAQSAFGANSPQYQLATQNLADKQNILWQAQQKAFAGVQDLIGAQDLLNQKNGALAKSTQFMISLTDVLNKGIQNARDYVADFGNKALDAANKVATLSGKLIDLQGKAAGIDRIQGQATTLQHSLQGNIDDINKLQNSKIPGLQGSSVNPQHRADGGPVEAGQIYKVGEAGPEYFVPRAAGAIVPNAASGGGTVINLHVGMMTGSAVEQRKAALGILKQLTDVARAKGITVAQLMGAQ